MSANLPKAIRSLPVVDILASLVRTLQHTTCCVVQASPGSGKTTCVPLALLHAGIFEERIIVLEPRRLAARAAATRMAYLLGEPVGRTVGYRIRHAQATSRHTRIEVVTEGILTRMLQEDPALCGIACVIFDEFHERSLQADLGLALCLESQSVLRPDLRLLVMSATLDSHRVASLMGTCPILTATAPKYPVQTVYHSPPMGTLLPCTQDALRFIAGCIRRVLHEEQGSILVFLPGMREIKKLTHLLGQSTSPDGSQVRILSLHGSLSAQEQDAALMPPPRGVRKVVLATAIAETSLTIEGIRVVVDSGLARVPRFTPRNGMNELVTRQASMASADQRRGRAGRQGPGVCHRLWSPAHEVAMPPFSTPEMEKADLAPLALELARWGATDPGALAWLTPPPQAAMTQARSLLAQLGALQRTAAGLWQSTPHGQAMGRLPVHPRLAHMLILASHAGRHVLKHATALAAWLTENPTLPRAQTNLPHLLEALPDMAKRHDTLAAGILRNIKQLQGMLSRQQWPTAKKTCAEQLAEIPAHELCGALCALAYPDRIAQQTEHGRFVLTCGQGASLPAHDSLAGKAFLVVPELDNQRPTAGIRLAAPLSIHVIDELFTQHIGQQYTTAWNKKTEAVEHTQRRTLWKLTLEEHPAPAPDSQEPAIAAMCQGIRTMGLQSLPWTPELQAMRQRITLLYRLEAHQDHTNMWPDVSDVALTDTLETWLVPFLSDVRRRAQLKHVDLYSALLHLLPWPLPKRLQEDAPECLTVPSGSSVRLDYSGPVPVLPVKLQEMFGATQTPAIVRGTLPILVQLLSPAGRPLQITQDIAGFWQNSYHQVKAEMKGRYPKHPWPDDPLKATPTKATRKAMQKKAT